MKIEGQNQIEAAQTNFPLQGIKPMVVTFSPKAQLIHDNEEDVFLAVINQMGQFEYFLVKDLLGGGNINKKINLAPSKTLN